MAVFQFKQFSIHQNAASMKVGTDGVLLGAWICKEEPVMRILDIGTGTGLIALMLAQKFSDAKITAIDIEKDAVEQAVMNAQNSEWGNRIELLHLSLEELMQKQPQQYDIIACNPPFFNKGWKIENEKRKKARDAEHLPLEQLVGAAKTLLSDQGSLQLILPVEEAEIFMKILKKSALYCKKLTRVFTKEGQQAKRYLMEIVQFNVETLYADLIIEHAGLNNFTDAYKKLTGDFYLHF